MKNLRVTLAAMAVTALTAPIASAATFLIDDFADAAPQIVADDPFGGILQGSEVGAAVPGGQRDLFVEANSGGAANSLATQMSVQGGALSYSNGANFGFGQVAYDGDDGDPTTQAVGAGGIDITGLGGFDLTFMGAGTKFFFDVAFADFDFIFRAIVWDMDGNTHTYSENIFGGAFSPFLSFTEFTSQGVDMTNVGALVFEVESDANLAADGVINSISVVPLPASALLLLGGLGGFAGMSAVGRRRRRKA